MRDINRLVLLLLCLAIALSYSVKYLYEHNQVEGANTAVIYKDGVVYQRVVLTGAVPAEIEVTGQDGHYNILEIESGRIRVKEADCPNKICVKTGWLTRPGQVSVCLPNRFKVVIESQADRATGVDDIAY